MGLTLSFSKSRSAAYNQVLKECRKFQNFSETDDLKTLQLGFTEIFDQWESFNSILHTAIKWTSFAMFIQDRSVSKSEVKKIFYSLQELKNCLLGYYSDIDKISYCGHTFWGCHRLTSVQVLPSWYTIDKGWYTIGSLENGSWKIDKEKILTKLLSEAERRYLDQCPNFNKEKIREVVHALPDRLDIANKHWRFKTSLQFKEGQFKDVVTGIEWIGDFSEFKPEQILLRNK